MPECFGKCLNGGICSNGMCSCPEAFEGANCQFSKDGEGVSDGLATALFGDMMILLVYAFVIALIVGIFFWAYKIFQSTKKSI